jgi:DNA-binding CsgD family transcriptional regulator
LHSTEALLGGVAKVTAESIEACLTSGMLVTSGAHTFAFRHELARTAIDDAISPPRRRDLHARVLAALQRAPAAEQDLARLAHHAEAAGDKDAVLRFAPAAGQQAATLYAHREAAAQFTRALRFAQDRPPRERAELLEATAYERYLIGLMAEAVELGREALQIWREIGDRLREGDALRWLSRFSYFAGHTDDAITAAEQALAVLDSLPPGRELAMAISNRAQLYMLAGETKPAIAWGERAIALAQDLGETEILVHALNNVGNARLRVGDESGREALERSLTLAREAGLEEHVGRALTNLGWNAIHARDLPRAETYLAAGIAYTTDHDNDGGRLYMLGWCSYLRLLSGDWTAASDDAAAVLNVPNVTPVSRIAALVARGLVRARRGDPGATEPLAEALSLAKQTGELQRLQPVCIARAEVAWLAGDHERVSAEITPILELALQRGSPWDIGEVLLWLQRAGLRESIESAPEPPILPLPYRCAMAGDWAGAAAAWEALGCPYEAALSRLDGDEEAARQALAIFERLGARAAAALAARRLRDRGVRAVPRGPRPSTRANPANLTARELEILPLLAAGLRNAEIAERLYLSTKTVGHHVGHILAKLDVHTRADVAAAATRLGLRQASDQNRVPDSPT